jgi:hypothetical protein
MSDIDRQRIAGVKTLLALGFTWREGRWVKSAALEAPVRPEADALHALVVDRADQLMSCIAGVDACFAGGFLESAPRNQSLGANTTSRFTTSAVIV